MSYPKTLGELWDTPPEALEALESAEYWEHKAAERLLHQELEEEQTQWLLDTVRELYALTQSSRYQSQRSPGKIREMVQGVLDACQADY